MSRHSRTAILKSPLCKQITESRETWLRCRGIRHPRFCISNFAQEIDKHHTFGRRTSASSCRKPSKWVPYLAHVPTCVIYAGQPSRATLLSLLQPHWPLSAPRTRRASSHWRNAHSAVPLCGVFPPGLLIVIKILAQISPPQIGVPILSYLK